MGEAHPVMHRPQRANPERSKNCNQFATPLETPPRHAGNTIVSGCSRFRSANQIAKMTNLASYFLASNGCEIELDSRHLRPDYRPLAQPLQGAIGNAKWRMSNDEKADLAGLPFDIRHSCFVIESRSE